MSGDPFNLTFFGFTLHRNGIIDAVAFLAAKLLKITLPLAFIHSPKAWKINADQKSSPAREKPGVVLFTFPTCVPYMAIS